jgi:N-formylglutamate amidohydrolase
MAVAKASEFSAVLNDRFRGGYITRQYGSPGRNIHVIQLELSQRNYMDEKDLRYDAGRAEKLSETIKGMLNAFVSSAN